MRAFLATLGACLCCFLAAAGVTEAQSTTHPQRKLRKALSLGMTQAGGAGGAYVVDLTTSRRLFGLNGNVGRMPASVEKLYTTVTALLRFGPTATLATTVLGRGAVDTTGTWSGTLYIRGGGDPTFGAASFDQYAYGTGATIEQLVADLVQRTGIKAIKGRILGDASYFDKLPGSTETGYLFDPYVEGALSALAFNRGLTNGGSAYVSHPALFAARQFVAALRAAGVKVPKGTPIGGGPTPTGTIPLASVLSPTVATLIALTNAPSDNFFAEMLLKGLGAEFGTGGSTPAGVSVVRDELASSFGIQPTLDDGSGLSRDDSTSPRQVVTLLAKMANNPAFTASLAIAGETGTLADEMRGTRAQGNCRGKTGTLHDVASLAGYCLARDGHTLAFAFLINGISDPNYAHGVEANMAVSIAKYNG